MAETIVVDTGPLVAMLGADDQHHALCCKVLESLRPPLMTTWLAITEAAWLLRNVTAGTDTLLQLLENDLIRCEPLDEQAIPWLRKFMSDYADLKPQLTDASLVDIADALDANQIFTLDRRDFTVYRSRHGKPFRLLPEEF